MSIEEGRIVKKIVFKYSNNQAPANCFAGCNFNFSYMVIRSFVHGSGLATNLTYASMRLKTITNAM